MIDTNRLERLKTELRAKGLDALFLGPSEDAQYLTRVTFYPDERQKGIMVTADGLCFLLVPKMYREEIAGACGTAVPMKIWDDSEGFVGAFRSGCEELGLCGAKIAFGNGVESYNLVEMKKSFDFQPCNGSGILAPLRSIKDAQELRCIEAASAIADEVMRELAGFIRPGLREGEIKKKILSLFEEKGAERAAFPPIVATGANGSISHYMGNDGIVQTGDLLKVDIGCVYRGYCSDTARTFSIGTPDSEQRRIFDTVKDAQAAGEEAIKPGATAQDLDRAARKVIMDAGYGAYFTNRLGHGTGMAVHEAPYIVEGNDTLLQPGNVFSIEPSIKIPGKCGVQIENLVMIDKNGYGKSFNKTARALHVID